MASRGIPRLAAASRPQPRPWQAQAIHRLTAAGESSMRMMLVPRRVMVRTRLGSTPAWRRRVARLGVARVARCLSAPAFAPVARSAIAAWRSRVLIAESGMTASSRRTAGSVPMMSAALRCGREARVADGLVALLGAEVERDALGESVDDGDHVVGADAAALSRTRSRRRGRSQGSACRTAPTDRSGTA